VRSDAATQPPRRFVAKTTFSGPPLAPPPTGLPPLVNPPPIPEGARPDGIYVSANESAALPVNTNVNLANVGMPRGSYQVTAKLVAINDSQDAQISIACGITPTQGGPEGALVDYSSVTVAPQSRVPLSLMGTYSYPLTIGTPVLYVACRASAGTASVKWTKLVATPVGKIN
jgi:hypothetical protein